jgi:hypothetical protein
MLSTTNVGIRIVVPRSFVIPWVHGAQLEGSRMTGIDLGGLADAGNSCRPAWWLSIPLSLKSAAPDEPVALGSRSLYA